MITIDTVNSVIYYLSVPFILLFGFVGVVYAMILAFRRITKV